MRAALIIVEPPGFEDVVGLGHRGELVHVQTFISQSAVKGFNRTFRHEVLDAYVFESLDQVREISAEWMREYHEERPHDTLDGMPPTNFRVRMTARSSPLILSP